MNRFYGHYIYSYEFRPQTMRLGASTGAPLGFNDVGKAVKLGTSGNAVLPTGGDEIDGFIDSVNPGTYGEGWVVGGVRRRERFLAQIGVNQGGSPMAVLDYVVADTPIAAGTVGYAQVKTGTPTKKLWQVLALYSTAAVANGAPDGAGTVGQFALVERV